MGCVRMTHRHMVLVDMPVVPEMLHLQDIIDHFHNFSLFTLHYSLSPVFFTG